jgi:quinol monooxygenase YgiN
MTTTKTDGTFGLVVRFVLKPGREGAFDELTEKTVAEIQQHEPGTLVYLCHHVDGAPSERIFYELYRDRGAFETHEAQPHVQRFLDARGPMLERVEVDFLSPAGRRP